MNVKHIRTKDEPEGGWLGPDMPDPLGRDLLDPEYAPARERPSIAVACGTKLVRGKLEWKWRPI